MFNVKRNGSSVEITDVPASVPNSVFKDIADETGAGKCLIAYVKGQDNYEVVIRHDNVNMAGAAVWLALKASEKISQAHGDYKRSASVRERGLMEAATGKASGAMEKHKVNGLFKLCYVLVI
ncbi:hypothetical protein GZ336_004353 [Salmonella enterica]|nr:hypothetical protein [Salmonella enterica]EIG1587788.1 hypothetical protein [Salmonella enterica]